MDDRQIIDLLFFLTVLSIGFMFWVLWNWIEEERRPARFRAAVRQHNQTLAEAPVAIWPPRPATPSPRPRLLPTLLTRGQSRS